MATIKVKVLSPIFYNNVLYKVDSILDMESAIYQKHKDILENMQFTKIYKENKKIEVNNE